MDQFYKDEHYNYFKSLLMTILIPVTKSVLNHYTQKLTMVGFSKPGKR